MTEQLRAAPYTRVSTAQQAAEDRVSLGQQRADIEAYCAVKGYEIVDWYEDAGFSGASKNRPSFKRLLRDSKEGLFDVVVCWRSDRLSRGMYPAAALMEALEGTDINIEAVTGPIDMNTFALQAVVGKIELDGMRQRAKMAFTGKSRKGIPTGEVKYGYQRGDDLTPIINATEAEVVQRIFDEAADGRALFDISEGLRQSGAVTRRGGEWSVPAIQRILRDETYIGKAYAGKRRVTIRGGGDKDVKVTHTNPRDEWIEIPYPPIVDAAAWTAAERRRKASRERRLPQGDTQYAYPLRGILWCGSCGAKYTGTHDAPTGWRRKADGTRVKVTRNKIYRYYKCYLGAYRRTKHHNADCPRKSMSAARIEGLVWDRLKDRLEHPDSINILIDARRKELEENGVTDSLARATNNLDDVEAERGRILTQHAKGFINDDELGLKISGIAERREYFAEKIANLETEASEAHNYVAMLESYKESASVIAERLPTLSDDEIEGLIRALVTSVTVYEHEIEVSWVFGPVPVSLATDTDNCWYPSSESTVRRDPWCLYPW